MRASSLDLVRRALLAVALGIAPFAAGCLSHEPLPSDVAHEPAIWRGPPLPIVVAVERFDAPAADRLEPLVAALAHESFVRVLRASRVVDRVEDRAPPVTATALAPPARPADVVLRGRVTGFELRSTYWWWCLYALLFALPFVGTASVIVAIVLGGPVATDLGALEIEVAATSARDGRPIGVYRGRFEDAQSHTIYYRVGVEESFVSHPEIMFQVACDRAIQEMGRDRFWIERVLGKAPTGTAR